MDIKSKFEFISSFKKIISVDFFHNYFNDGKLKFFDIITDSKTLSLMKNYDWYSEKKMMVLSFYLTVTKDSKVHPSMTL